MKNATIKLYIELGIYRLNLGTENKAKRSKLFSLTSNNLLSAAAILSNSFISMETNCCTPSECKISFFRNWIFSSESDCRRFAPLAIVLATSKANIDILCPLEAIPDTNPLLGFKLDMLLPSVSKTSTAFSRPATPALPRKELFWGT